MRQPAKGQKDTLVNKHKDDIIDLLNRGLHATTITDTICTMYHYPPNTITGKQVSDWIAY
jgi:hypothetical protein